MSDRHRKLVLTTTSTPPTATTMTNITNLFTIPVPCIDTDNHCQYLNDTIHVCNDPHLAKDLCKLYCGFCQAG